MLAMSSVVNCTVSAVYAKLIHQYLKNCALGLDESKKLQQLFLNRYDDLGGQIAVSELEILIQKAKYFIGDAPLGLEVGRHIHPSDFGIIGYALMNCKTLEQAYFFATKYKHILNSGLAVKLHASNDAFHFQMKCFFDSKDIGTLIEIDFAAALQLSRLLVGSQKCSQVKFLNVRFQHAPQGNLEIYHSVFACPVEFNQSSNEIVIAKEVLDLPVRSYDTQMFKMCLRKIQRIFNSGQLEDAMHRQVFVYVANYPVDEILNIQIISDHFNMSPSTLKKRLKCEGYHFSQICDSVQKSRSIKLVGTPTIHLKEVGRSLGFSSPSAFNRAFKRWTGMTPVEYRRMKLCEVSI